MEDPTPQLPINDMAERHVGLSEPLAACFEEAARVCLDRHHESPVAFEIDGLGEAMQAMVEWEKTDDRTVGAWANDDDATEYGAYGCALAALELSDGLVALRRAETGTGADYYVGPPGTAVEDLEGFVRFEVSGVDRGSHAVIENRLKDKLDQASHGNSNLPALAGVVGFRMRLILVARLVADELD